MNSIITNQGLNHIADIIFENLDNLSLCKCLEVCCLWYQYLHKSVLYHRRQLRQQIIFHDEKTWMKNHIEWKSLVENVEKNHDIEAMAIMTYSLRRMIPFVKNQNSQQVSECDIYAFI